MERRNHYKLNDSLIAELLSSDRRLFSVFGNDLIWHPVFITTIILVLFVSDCEGYDLEQKARMGLAAGLVMLVAAASPSRHLGRRRFPHT